MLKKYLLILLFSIKSTHALAMAGFTPNFIAQGDKKRAYSIILAHVKMINSLRLENRILRATTGLSIIATIVLGFLFYMRKFKRSEQQNLMNTNLVNSNDIRQMLGKYSF